MSLLNLSCTTPRASSVNAAPVTADTFIDEALHYASGQSCALSVATAQLSKKVSATTAATEEAEAELSLQPMRRATFTLTEECIAQLQAISDQSGVAKSKLIRLWIAHFSRTRSDW